MTIETLTLALVIVGALSFCATVIYAIFTYQMASTMKMQFDADRRPFLAFDRMNVFLLPGSAVGKVGVQIELVFRNVGKVLLHYSVEDIRATVAGRTVDEPRMHSRGGHVFPGVETVFRYDTIPVDVQADVNNGIPVTGVVEYRIVYRAVGNNASYISRKKIGYDATSAGVRYSFLEDEET